VTRVLALTNWYPPHHTGGYELSCFDVMTRLVARGHEVRVLCSDERRAGASPADPEHEARVTRALRLYHRDGDLWRPPIKERLAIERHNQAALEAVLQEHRPEVVSVWHMAALSLGLLTTLIDHDIPLVFAVCDDWLSYGEVLDTWSDLFRSGPLRHAAGRLVSAVTRVPTRVPQLGKQGGWLFVSDLTQRRSHELSRFTFGRETVVYSGIDRSVFAPEPAPSPSPRPWSWRLLFVGRWDPRKGAQTAIRALVHLPEATLACYGRGPASERDTLAALAHALGVEDRVTIREVDRHDLPPVYAAADVFVFPSEWDEPFGLVPIEAMACGTPVVATARGGSAEFLEDGVTCVRFEEGDAADLARAVTKLHDDPSLRRTLVDNGYALAEQLDVDKLADTFEAWHTYAANRFEGPPPPERKLRA
jgi:glycogen(starch) synthase